jgi:hypothetical protein
VGDIRVGILVNIGEVLHTAVIVDRNQAIGVRHRAAVVDHSLEVAVEVAHKVVRKRVAKVGITRKVAVQTLKSLLAQAASNSRDSCGVAATEEVVGSIRVRED